MFLSFWRPRWPSNAGHAGCVTPLLHPTLAITQVGSDAIPSLDPRSSTKQGRCGGRCPQGLSQQAHRAVCPPTGSGVSLPGPTCTTTAAASCRLARAHQPQRRGMARRGTGAEALSYVTRPPLCLFSHNFLNLLGDWGKEPLFGFGCEVLDASLPGLRPSDPSNEDRWKED